MPLKEVKVTVILAILWGVIIVKVHLHCLLTSLRQAYLWGYFFKTAFLRLLLLRWLRVSVRCEVGVRIEIFWVLNSDIYLAFFQEGSGLMSRFHPLVARYDGKLLLRCGQLLMRRMYIRLRCQNLSTWTRLDWQPASITIYWRWVLDLGHANLTHLSRILLYERLILVIVMEWGGRCIIDQQHAAFFSTKVVKATTGGWAPEYFALVAHRLEFDIINASIGRVVNKHGSWSSGGTLFKLAVGRERDRVMLTWQCIALPYVSLDWNGIEQLSTVY